MIRRGEPGDVSGVPRVSDLPDMRAGGAFVRSLYEGEGDQEEYKRFVAALGPDHYPGWGVQIAYANRAVSESRGGGHKSGRIRFDRDGKKYEFRRSDQNNYEVEEVAE